MRMSRVLLAGVAVAGAVATTSAFTAGNTFDASGALDDNAGYGQLTVTGVTVSNVAYVPLAADTSKLDNVVFTITEATNDMNAFMVDQERVQHACCRERRDQHLRLLEPRRHQPHHHLRDAQHARHRHITKVGLTVVSK